LRLCLAENDIHHQGEYDSEQQGDGYRVFVPVFMRDHEQTKDIIDSGMHGSI
jgi:hypothetical protein